MFQPIGELCRDVMGELATKRSAGAASAEIEGEPTNREVRGSSPIAQTAGGTASNLNGVDGSSGESAHPVSGAIVKEPSTPKRPVPNTMLGSITVAHRRRSKEVIPASGAAVIDLGMERAKRHASTLPRTRFG